MVCLTACRWYTRSTRLVSTLVVHRLHLDLERFEFGQESWSVWTKAVGTAAGKKGKSLFMPLRKALTGRAFGPDMGVLLCYMKAETVRQRLAGQTA